MKCFSGELPDCRVPVTDLPFYQMVHEGPGVLGEPGYEHADLQVGVRALPDSEIVRFCENVDSVRKRALEIRGNLIIKQCFGLALVSMQTGSRILSQKGSGSKQCCGSMTFWGGSGSGSSDACF